MKIVIIYGSTEGQTAKVAEVLERHLRDNGHSVFSQNANAISSEATLPTADLYIVAASLHSGRYQAGIETVARNNAPALNHGRSILLSVSLSAAGSKADIDEVGECVESLAQRTGWRPTEVEHVAGAFRFSSYGLFKRLALQYIAYRKGQPTDTSRDYELTDWTKLNAFANRVAPPVTAPPIHEELGGNDAVNENRSH